MTSGVGQHRGQHNESPKTFVESLVGKANECKVLIDNKLCSCLIDTGSMVSTVSNAFLRKELSSQILPITNFNLTVYSSSGNALPYLGYIEADIRIPKRSPTVTVPLLVVPDTDYNANVPVIIGTNVLKLFSDISKTFDHGPWSTALNLLQNNGCIGILRSTNNKSLNVPPNESLTVEGSLSEAPEVTNTVIAEQANSSLSGALLVSPQIVQYNRHGWDATVAVRICNITAQTLVIPPKSSLCELQLATPVPKFAQTDTPRNINSHIESSVLEPFGSKINRETLTSIQQLEVENLLERWSCIMSTSNLDLGHTHTVNHEINLSDNISFKEPHRRIPPALMDEVKQHLKEMLACGAIRESNSPYSSNVVLVRKPDGSLRFCIDFRKLNAKTIRDSYALPRIDETLDCLSGSKWFTKLDLRSGYWQVEMREQDKPKTAFTVGPLGFYECNRMPFGLTNAPATFQRLMERCLKDLHLKECLIYLDDIIIFSKTFDQHLVRLESVFLRLWQHGLKLKPSKCEFFKSEIKYLGHIVSENGIATDPEKISALKQWPRPRNIKDLRKFLGFAGYYRRYIRDYAKIVKCLNDLLVGQPKTGHKTKSRNKFAPKWQWNEEHQTAFETTIEKLTTPPILAYADYSLPFLLHVDASAEGLGAALYQNQDGVDRAIAYGSRGLKKTEKNYPAHKREFLALKWSVCDKFKDYLYGHQFTVKTDNNPLTYVLSTAKLDATGHRWLAELSTYSFNISYKSGLNHLDADGLSRHPSFTPDLRQTTTGDVVEAICRCKTNTSTVPFVESLAFQEHSSQEEVSATLGHIRCLVASSLVCLPLLNDATGWRKAQLEDLTIGRVIHFLETGEKPNKLKSMESWEVKSLLRYWDKLELRDGVLYKVSSSNDSNLVQLILPFQFKELVLTSLHDDMGHQGQTRTLDLVRSRFYWPGMAKDVNRKVRFCHRCICRKTPVSSKTAFLVSVQTSQPLELVCIDYLSLEPSKGGFDSILVITDHFTRYAQAVPTRNQSAKTTAKALFDNFFVHYGLPAKLHSDQGRNFESNLIKELCKLVGVKKTRTTPYHPEGNGMCERFNHTLLNMLGTLTEDQKADWKSYVPSLVHAYNATKHESTSHSPFYLLFGRHPRLSIDAYLGIDPNHGSGNKNATVYASELKRRLQYAYKLASQAATRSGKRHKHRYDLRVRESGLELGDRVLVKKVGIKGKHKLADRWDQQTYIVVAQPNPGIPVFKVRNELNNKYRILHRNMLLPFQSVPALSPLVSKRRQSEKRPHVNTPSSSSGSESDPEFHTLTRAKLRPDAPPFEPSWTFPTTSPVPLQHPPAAPPEVIVRRSTRTRQPPQWYRSGDWIVK